MRTPLVLRIALLFTLACGGGSPSESEAPASETTGEATAMTEAPADEPEPATEEAPAPRAAPAPAPPSTEGWATVVSTYVTEDGGFRYAALRANEEHRALLTEYCEAVSNANSEGWSRDAALAFYINAYNAITVNDVLELWPVESVMQEEGFFDGRQHRVAGREMTLNQLENDIIRSETYAEPRIHFAVNCASTSCPPLQPEPFSAENLEDKLAAATRAFVQGSTRVRGNRVNLSKLFEWFEGDFERVGGVRAFVASQLEAADADVVRNERSRLRHDEYDWDLNDRP